MERHTVSDCTVRERQEDRYFVDSSADCQSVSFSPFLSSSLPIFLETDAYKSRKRALFPADFLKHKHKQREKNTNVKGTQTDFFVFSSSLEQKDVQPESNAS